jgi:hypothetical protein
MIWAKKRFQVLARDGFRCYYCWKNGKDVSLEVDHIIPKKKWWSDEITNLVCSCRECNMWKWSMNLEKIYWEIHKVKIKDLVNSLKKFFLDERNAEKLWEIEKRTLILLYFFIWLRIDWENYCAFLDIKILKNYWYDYPMKNKQIEQIQNEFKEWWEFCDDVLSIMFEEKKEYLERIIEDVKNGLLLDNWQEIKNYSDRLNFCLSRIVFEEEEWEIEEKKLLYVKKLSKY